MRTQNTEVRSNSSELLIANAATVRMMEEALASGPSDEALRLARINIAQAESLCACIVVEQLVERQNARKRDQARAALRAAA